MLDSLKLELLWLIIEQEETVISSKMSDAEIIKYTLEQLKAQMLLSNSELIDIYIYVQSRIPLIRDIAEVQSVKILKK
ncbi:MAG: hypothetical protein ACFCAD_21860 [Pleurocapsa sp.]